MGRDIVLTDNGEAKFAEARANGTNKVSVKAAASLGADVTFVLPLVGSTTWNPGNIADGDREEKAVTVTGAALGDFAIASFSLDIATLDICAAVTATDEVTVSLVNSSGSGVDLASGTVKATVISVS